MAARDELIDDAGEPGDKEPEVSAARETPTRLQFSPLVEVGWRYFDYSNVSSIENTPALRHLGSVLIGARAELVPVRALKNLSVQAAGGYGVPQDLKSTQGMVRAVLWRADAAATYRIGITSNAQVLALAGYAHSRYRFEGPRAALGLVPDATYSQVRLGVGLSGRLGWLELLAQVENRLVLSGGVFADRFRSASADGLAAALTLVGHLGPRYFARLEGSVIRYGWSFTYELDDTYRAGGASDVMLGVSMSAGAAF